MKKMLGIFLTLVLFAVFGFFMIGFQNSVPTSTLSVSANATFNNQSQMLQITYTGLNMIELILIAAMFITVAFFLYKIAKSRR